MRKSKFKQAYCEHCNTPISRYSNCCINCRHKELTKETIKIDPKYLVRGNISGGTRGCAISGEA